MVSTSSDSSNPFVAIVAIRKFDRSDIHFSFVRELIPVFYSAMIVLNLD